jgi:SulP family sulfate permease
LGARGLVVAIIVGIVVAALLGSGEVLSIGDLVDVPRVLPGPRPPSLQEVPGLLIPAASLAFVSSHTRIVRGPTLDGRGASPRSALPPPRPSGGPNSKSPQR